ncbi:carboxypeptidase-like regulatory domain-containing protein [Winogradskyella sp. 4-2091]|uniref:carboxypeptidase-like regulatory domain-containing protein n=1 Tax=Winogradskyella sp. 4-2091 TaxID=3381659 RepID=UPI003891857F
MKSNKVLLTILLLFCLSFNSCEKDDGNLGGDQQEIIPNTFSEYFGNTISRDFIGNVVDTNNNPIEGVTITIGNDIAITDNNGVFLIKDANVKERFGYIIADKTGYIHGSRSIIPSNGTNKVTIMLLEANIVGAVNSGNSETVSLTNGSSVSFDGNFIKEDGSTYSGSVDVIMHHLDPADEDMALQMPGMLYAQNEEGAERLLQTFGMLAVELRGSGGEELNLAEGSTSEIEIKKPYILYHEYKTF